MSRPAASSRRPAAASSRTCRSIRPCRPRPRRCRQPHPRARPPGRLCPRRPYSGRRPRRRPRPRSWRCPCRRPRRCAAAWFHRWKSCRARRARRLSPARLSAGRRRARRPPRSSWKLFRPPHRQSRRPRRTSLRLSQPVSVKPLPRPVMSRSWRHLHQLRPATRRRWCHAPLNPLSRVRQCPSRATLFRRLPRRPPPSSACRSWINRAKRQPPRYLNQLHSDSPSRLRRRSSARHKPRPQPRLSRGTSFRRPPPSNARRSRTNRPRRRRAVCPQWPLARSPSNARRSRTNRPRRRRAVCLRSVRHLRPWRSHRPQWPLARSPSNARRSRTNRPRCRPCSRRSRGQLTTRLRHRRNPHRLRSMSNLVFRRGRPTARPPRTRRQSSRPRSISARLPRRPLRPRLCPQARRRARPRSTHPPSCPSQSRRRPARL